ncbi:DUF2868 domain-containing protein [Pseudohalioglobus lutimaris]|uniref:DUF2868 domain-containing protein n=1 Tax=Pseudohalioglobus lutimaris TaxID=1737061 RepID=A0A2N5X579_9GAMM|nr:DUF2868 domain-containing protein [Pseudohalioglobus lutimaris]PLW69642.1 hypothetical protein C0039_06430 [Pseudohalioglobus lutimaris]
MSGNAASVTLNDLYRLGQQLEAERDLPASVLRERDHALGLRCTERDDTGRLLYWLDKVACDEDQPGWFTEAHTALLLRLLALLAGALAVGGFLLASERALINVFLFQLLFVFLPLFFSLLAAVVMLRSVRGRPPAVSPFNPARLVANRALPAQGELREASAALRLLMLRYGQELGVLFALGVIAAFLVLLAFTDFSFVWGSTFGFSDSAVSTFNNTLSLPWSSWLPQAVVPADVVTATRYHAAQLDLSGLNEASKRGWWSFLAMCLVTYALLPRFLLWLLSRRLYRREVTRSFLTFPGAAAVLARMRSPVVKTQAGDTEHVDARSSVIFKDDGALLLEWAGALAELGAAGLQLASPENHLRAGLGSPADDLDCIELVNQRRPKVLRVAVKSWEPPMADLADVLGDVRNVSHCILQLIPLQGKQVNESSIRDWQEFGRELGFTHTDVQPLELTA